MGTLQVSLFGQFDAQWDGQVVTDLYPPKLQELVGYLLLHRDRPQPRETLASQLWGDSSTAQSKKNLRQALWQLQKASDGNGFHPNRDLLEADAERVCISPAAHLWVDVAAFEQAYERTHGLAGQVLDPPRVQALQEAVELYRGDLLEGWFQDWCLYERERFQNMYLAILDKLMDHCQAYHEYEAGLAYGERILRYDPARERTHRRMMRLYYLSGDRTAALRQYEHCRVALRRELSVKPAAPTLALYEQIRNDQLAEVASPQHAAELGAPDPSLPRWPDMLEELKQLQRTLTHVQSRLRRAIHTAELAVKEQLR